jgi:hypothetical protein
MEMEWIGIWIGVARGLRGRASGARTSWSDKLEVASWWGCSWRREGCLDLYHNFCTNMPKSRVLSVVFR